MFGLTALRSAVSTLTANLTGLAGTVGEINTHLRQRAGLDGSAEAPALPTPAAVAELPAPESAARRRGKEAS